MKRPVTLAAAIAAVSDATMTSGAGGDHAAGARLQQKVAGLDRRLTRVTNEFNEDGDLFRVLKTSTDKIDLHTATLRTPNVVTVVATVPVPEDGAATANAFCPAGDQVISGGHVHGALNGIVNDALPIQKPNPGFEVQVREVPGLVPGNQDTTLTPVAYCAPFSRGNVTGDPFRPVVLGSTVPVG